jgi:cyclophilin family peptidyl-prolyl cis-trans isomerase/HEAT repeat protein
MLALAGVLLASAACAPRARQPGDAPAARRDVAAARGRVLDDRAVRAVADLLRMEDRRALDAERLAAYLADPDPFVRSRAVLAAGRVADTAALPSLRAELEDASADVRSAAAFALGEMGDTSAATIASLAALLADPRAGETAVAEAAHALGKLPTAGSYAALSALLTTSKPASSAVAREALLAIWRHPRQGGTLGTVQPWTGHADRSVRWAATYALMRVTAAPAVPRLLELLRDTDPQIRALAARGLRAGAVDSASLREQARAALAARVRDEHAHVRINAVRALAGFGSAADAPALVAALEDTDANVRLAALEALAQLPAAAVGGSLEQFSRDTAGPLALRAAALTSLARTDTARALPLLAAWSSAQPWLQRFYAARALGAVRFALADTILRTLARDPDGRVQGEAFGTLAADTTARVETLFLEGLAAPDPVVRAAAATGLARQANPAFLAALMQAYDRAQQDTINDAALAALDALAALARHGTPVAASFFLRFQRSTDPVVRARVAQHFGAPAGSWGPPRPIDSGHEIGWYEQRVRELVAPALFGKAGPRVRLQTARGDIILELAAGDAPLTVHNFLALVRSDFYERGRPRWHRVVPNFVLQDGDPRGDGSGGPPWNIRDEINPLRYERGTLGMALSGPDTGGSQFFITHSAQPHLDGGYTVFGRVTAGMEVADAIVQDDEIVSIEVLP